MLILNRASAIIFCFPVICINLRLMSSVAVKIAMFLVMAARIGSLVLSELITITTAWLSQCITILFLYHL